MCKLVDLQIEYLMTIGDHSAPLPDFLKPGCLVLDKDGTVRLNLGPDSQDVNENNKPECKRKQSSCADNTIPNKTRKRF
jgi:hypothetical protein